MVSNATQPRLLLASMTLVLGLSACSSTSSAPERSTSSPSSPAATSVPVSADDAFAAYHASTSTINNASGQLTKFETANTNQDLGTAKTAATAYRNTLFAWDSEVRALKFPDAATAQVNTLLADNRTELADLDAFATVADTGQDAATAKIELDDDSGLVASDGLDKALGHPSSAAAEAADQLRRAGDAFAVANIPAANAFNTAHTAHDFPGLITATTAESTALTDYITAVSALTSPPAANGDLARFMKAAQKLESLYAQRLAATDITGLLNLGIDSSPLQNLLNARTKLQTAFDSAQ